MLQNVQAELAEAISNEEITDIISPPGNLAVHVNTIKTQLTQTLKNTYPLIAALLGEEFFYQTALEYSERYPSSSGDLHEYGEYFPGFLAHYSAVKDYIYLAETAQFEWQCHQLFFAAEHITLDITQLADVSPEHYADLHLTLHPASSLMQCQYPILKIIDVCHGKLDKVHLEEGGVNLLIIRPELEIKLIPLTDAEYEFLSAISYEAPLAASLEAALALDANFDLATKLPEWIQQKVIVNISQL